MIGDVTGWASKPERVLAVPSAISKYAISVNRSSVHNVLLRPGLATGLQHKFHLACLYEHTPGWQCVKETLDSLLYLFSNHDELI